MARGNKIVVGTPRGKFIGGIINDTSKPGTVMEMVAAGAVQGGRNLWQASSVADGLKREICVLMDDPLQGFGTGQAYVAGRWGQLYFPVDGDELNMILEDVSGTGDSAAIGDLFGVNEVGKLEANSSFTFTPFEACEAIAKGGITADILLYVRFRGAAG